MPEINLIPTSIEPSPLDAYKRKILAAQLMQRQSDDTSQPVYSQRAAWAKAGQGIVGGLMEGLADREQLSEQREAANLVAQYRAANAQPSAPVTPSAAASPMGDLPGLPSGALPSGRSTNGKIYSNDEPSPLDPPTGDDRARMMATILGESANQPAVGQNAVASVIRNRAIDGGYGGDTPSGVVTAKNQFEPWNTESGRAKMATMLQDPNLATKADNAIKLAYGEDGSAPNDPTNGAKNFIEPKLQTSLGRPMPQWAQQPGEMIGDHKFIGGVPGGDQQPYQVAGPATAAPQPAAVPDRNQLIAQQLAPQPSQGVTDRQALTAKLLGNPRALQMLQALKALEGAPIKLGEGENLYDSTTYKPLTQNGSKQTDIIRDYNMYRSQGGTKSFEQYQTDLKQAGASRTNVTVDQKPELAFDTEAGKLQANRFNDLAGEGQTARQLVSDVKTLQDLGAKINTGKLAEAKAVIGPYAEALGLKVDGLKETQAYDAIVNRVAPSLRVKGSGAQSDLELRNFLKSLPSLGNTPEGNRIASEVLTGLQENKIRASEIGSRALTKEITRAEAEKQLRELPDPMTNYRKYMEAQDKTPNATSPASAPDRSALEAEARRRGLIK